MHEDVIAIEAIKQGDRDRYAELVDRYSRLVYGIAWSRLGDAAMSEDAAQEAFVQGFQFLGALRRPESFAAWIGKIARNVASRIARRHSRALEDLHRWQLEQCGPAADQPAADGTFDKPVQELLSDTLEDLSDTHRECLVLFYLQGKSVREAADALGVSENAFRTRLHRARADLREKLEAQLGPAIGQLRPQERLRDKVLAVIPAAPIGWGGKGLTFGTLLGGLQSVGLSLLSPVFTLLLVGWAGRGMARNYREGSEFRKRILWQNYLMLALFLVPWMLLAGWIRSEWGGRALFSFLAIYTLPALVQGALLLRVNRSPFTVAILVGTASMTVGFLAIGLFGLPFQVFIVAMLIFNVGLWPGLKSMPLRGDYNLFLRAAMNGLREPQTEGALQRPLTADDLRAFARFLGERFLVADYSLRRSGCVLYLPPIRNSPMATFLWPIARFNGSSSIGIASDGTCRANLAPRDAYHLRGHVPAGTLDSSRLQQQVCIAIGESLRLFLAGDAAGAGRILQVQEDAAIFLRPVHKLTRMRVLFLIAILGAFVSLGVFWMSGQRFLPSPDKVVTAEDARTALIEWVSTGKGPGSTGHVNLAACLTAYPIPPASFWPPAQADAIRRFGLEEIRRQAGDSPRGACDVIEGNGLLLRNLLTGGYASVEDLRQVGLTRENLLKGLDESGTRDLFGKPPLSRTPGVNRASKADPPQLEIDSRNHDLKSQSSHDRLRDYAYRLWCLRQLDLLGDIDTAGAAELLAAHQLPANPEAPLQDAFPANAVGLFWVSDPFFVIEDTWAVLFSLQALGRLDVIDREVCVAGLMRCYRGKGDFAGGFNSRRAGNLELIQSDAYHAMESLIILGTLDRIPDLKEWSFEAKWCQDRNGKLVRPFVTPTAIGTWAWQTRLDAIRAQTSSRSGSHDDLGRILRGARIPAVVRGSPIGRCDQRFPFRALRGRVQVVRPAFFQCSRAFALVDSTAAGQVRAISHEPT